MTFLSRYNFEYVHNIVSFLFDSCEAEAQKQRFGTVVTAVIAPSSGLLRIYDAPGCFNSFRWKFGRQHVQLTWTGKGTHSWDFQKSKKRKLSMNI